VTNRPGRLVKYFGWRAAFVVPGLIAIACGIVFARVAPHEHTPPSKRAPRQLDLPKRVIARALLVVTLTSTGGSLVFNFTTNGNGELLRERMVEITRDPALLGLLMSGSCRLERLDGESWMGHHVEAFT